MADLSDRFREVHVTLEHQATPPRDAPSEWLQVQACGNVLSFVDTQFSEGNLAEQVESVAGTPRRIDAQPMSLRSIFTTLSRAARDRSVGNGNGPSLAGRAQEAEELRVG